MLPLWKVKGATGVSFPWVCVSVWLPLGRFCMLVLICTLPWLGLAALRFFWFCVSQFMIHRQGLNDQDVLQMRGVCWFPLEAVWNWHEFAGFKQYRFLIFQLWTSEVWYRSRWLNSGCWQGCVPLGGYRGESVSLSFPASTGCPCSHPPSSSKSAVVGGAPYFALSDTLPPSPSSCIRTPVITLGSPGWSKTLN